MTTPTDISNLQALPVSELVAVYEREFGRPPRLRQKSWLWKRIAWKRQERRLGGLSKAAKARLEQLIGEIDLPVLSAAKATPPATVTARRTGPSPGTVLTRNWHGREIRVTTLEHGFELDGETYRSLSAVAKAVTGTQWNGKLWFGLTERKPAS